MIIRTQKRPGVTLIEVLVATGILAIGIISIMALFPIGAVSMVRAINQNRASDHAANSDAMLRFYWKRAWLDTNGGGVRPLEQAYLAERAIQYLDRMPGSPPPPFPGQIPATSSQPSYPVLIDPIGFQTQLSNGPAFRYNIGGQAFLPVRSSLTAAEQVDPSFPLRPRIRVTTLLDDLTFDINGEPSAASLQLERAGRYNVAWMIQRPKNNVPHEVHVRVMVFAGRSPTDTPSSEDIRSASTPASGPYFDRDIDPKPNTLVISLGGQSKPAVRKGGWIAFSQQIQTATVIYWTIDFYRVSAITDDNANQISIELEQPLKSYDINTLAGRTPVTPTTCILNGVVIFFDNLIEVFDRGIMSATGISGR